ncbi:MAG: glycerate kinase [Thermoplasmata archaeon]|nr:MAG: glycerate kinase [Thermoplasmata archaeon]
MRFENKKQIIANGKTDEIKKIRKDILEMLSTAIDAVDPYCVVSSQFDKFVLKIDSKKVNLADFSNIYLVAFGKASIGMTQAALDHCEISKGVVITNDITQKIKNPAIDVFYGDHPIPNDDSINGAKAAEKLISQVSENDLLLILISGGGSALLCHPRVSLKDLQETTSYLLKSGANIQEINTIRKHISYVKGGQLIQNAKCQVISFVISDVIGDPLSFIASGPTIGDETKYEHAKNIFEKYNLWEIIPKSVQSVIIQGIAKEIPETPFIHEISKDKVKNMVIANNTLACETLLHHAEKLGYKPSLYSTTLQGEARIVGNQLVDILIEKNKKEEINMLIAGGETTVTVKGSGKGGRNQEMVLASLNNLQKNSIVFASFGTDGIDGMSTAAGAIADSNSLKRAIDKNLNVDVFLADNNSNVFFHEINDLLITGPTGTNVMDVQILIKQ